MENTENKPTQNLIGHLYGGRISKNHKWLNVTIVATIDGKDVKICVPVRMIANEKKGKPVVTLDWTGENANIENIPVYYGDTKKAENDGLPF